MRYEVVQNCPVPAPLAPFLRLLLTESGAQLQSCYRGTDAEALLHKCGKQSQRQLYEGYIKAWPGYLPANPPGRSTHELFSDGTAYAGPPGRKLLWWQCGMDIDNAHVDVFIKTALKHGWHVYRPYTAGTEFHHVNFVKAPLAGRVKGRVASLLRLS